MFRNLDEKENRMPHFLRNQHIELLVDLPDEGYRRPRFDWTGKIVAASYRGQSIAGQELLHADDDPFCGKGFYNEFGIDAALGFEETKAGDWFHKIGVGLLRKEGETYQFHHPYEIRPARFEVFPADDHIRMVCRSVLHNGYAYLLEKIIRIEENGFSIHYHLENLGDNPIHTTEYCHNFLCVDGAAIGPAYRLTFPFRIQPERLGEAVNPEELVHLGEREVEFAGTPAQPFFFSNLSGGEQVPASWKLEHSSGKVAISETCDFHTNAINLWGVGHVISPELFIQLEVLPGKSQRWRRSYQFFRR